MPPKPEDPQAIAHAFSQGYLSDMEGQFFRCDYISPALGAPFVVIGAILPLPLLVICFGQAIVRDPGVVVTFYERTLTLDLASQLLLGAIAIGVTAFTIWLFIQGYPIIKSTILGIKECSRERTTKQYRYGLLLTPQHFSLRCFRSPFYPEPTIIAIDQIVGIYLRTKYSEASHHHIKYLEMRLKQPDDSVKTLLLPTTNLDCPILKLLPQLTSWLSQGR